MELKARLASLEHQINSLQSCLLSSELGGSKENKKFTENLQENENLKTVLMKLKMEHEGVLRGIEKALELVDSSPLRTPEKSFKRNLNVNNSPSPRLREKINSVLTGNSSVLTGTPNNPNNSNSSQINQSRQHQVLTSSPLSPAVEKSHITFDILNELHEFKGKRKVHFDCEETEEEMSVASREYLRKYGLI